MRMFIYQSIDFYVNTVIVMNRHRDTALTHGNACQVGSLLEEIGKDRRVWGKFKRRYGIQYTDGKSWKLVQGN